MAWHSPPPEGWLKAGVEINNVFGRNYAHPALRAPLRRRGMGMDNHRTSGILQINESTNKQINSKKPWNTEK